MDNTSDIVSRKWPEWQVHGGAIAMALDESCGHAFVSLGFVRPPLSCKSHRFCVVSTHIPQPHTRFSGPAPSTLNFRPQPLNHRTYTQP